MPIDPVRLTQALVKCQSVTPADDGAQVVMKAPLQEMGFRVFDLPFGVVQNFFARLDGPTPHTNGKHLCYAGHTDVVPAGDEAAWTHKPFAATIDQNRLYGRGTADMKANNACFVAAVSRYLETHKTLNGSISFLITGDEEGPATDGTVRVLEWMKDNHHIPDACLVGEPSNPKQIGDEIKIGRRGSLTGALRVEGKQGHVAYPQLADNPLPKMAMILHALSSHHFDNGNDFFPATNLELTTIDTGNKADNVIPQSVQAQFNVRFNDAWTAQSLEADIRRHLDEIAAKGGIEYDLKCDSNAAAFLTTPGAFSALMQKSVFDITGRTPQMTTNGGTSDARFISQYCPVIECGLINKTIHQIDEHVELEDMETLTQIYLRLIERFFEDEA